MLEEEWPGEAGLVTESKVTLMSANSIDQRHIACRQVLPSSYIYILNIYFFRGEILDWEYDDVWNLRWVM